MKIEESSSPLELDMYCDELKVAIEHNGEQHYRPIDFFGGETVHFELVSRDMWKAKLCHENGVQLIIVPYSIKEEDIQQYLKIGLGISDTDTESESGSTSSSADTIITMVQEDKQQELERMVKDKRGKLISGSYVTTASRITLECDKGHQWSTSIIHIKTGAWCHTCGLEVKDETKTKISVTLIEYNQTDEGKQTKKESHAKRSITMAKVREEIRSAITEKECRKCKVTKAISEYGPKNTAKDSLQPYCKPCQKLAKQEWRRKQAS